jgi:hypothetical protein
MTGGAIERRIRSPETKRGTVTVPLGLLLSPCDPTNTGRDGEADLRSPPNDVGGHRHYFFFAGAFFLAAGFFAGAFLAAGFFVVVLAKGVLLSMWSRESAHGTILVQLMR